MKTFTKKYQLWQSMGEAYAFQEFDTLQECITAPHAGDWYITKKVSLSVTDAEEKSQVITPNISYVEPRSDQSTAVSVSTSVERTPEELAADDLAAKYAAGPIGNITN